MRIKRGVSLLAVAITAVLGVSVIQRTFAATGSIYVSPASATVQKGNNVTVEVRINPGVATDGVEFTMSYDTAKLQFVSMNAGGSPYPLELASSGGSGSVQMTRGHLTGTVSANNSLITKVTFKALAGGTSATLGLSGNSTTAGAYNNPGVSGASLSLANPPAPAPTPTPTPTPAPTPTPTPAPNPSPAPDSGTPTSGGSGSSSGGTPTSGQDVSNTPETKPNQQTTIAADKKLQLADLQFKKASFKITSSKRFRVYIKYGSGNQLNISTKLTGFAKEHTVGLDSKTLVPGTTYSYVVVTEDENGKTEQSSVSKFKTEGYTVRVSVLGKNNEPIKDQLVSLFSEPMTTRTNDEGIAVFEDVAPGKHSVQFENGGNTVTQAIEVLDNVVVRGATEIAEPQTFAVVFEDVDASPLPLGVIVALVGVLAIAGAFVYLMRAGKLEAITSRFNRPGPGASGGTGGVVVGGPSGDAGSSSPSSSSEVDEMLNKVPGTQHADPGSVISPNEEKEQ